MKRSIHWAFWVFVSCLCISCAHNGGTASSTVEQKASEVAASSTQGTPVMEVPETSHDFGKVKDTEGEVVHEFTIKNTGTGMLQIKKVLPG